MTDTIATGAWQLRPGMTETEAQEVARVLSEVCPDTHRKCKMAGLSMTWMPVALAALKSAIEIGGPIALRLIAALEQSGLIVPATSPLPAKT
jgi:hypothetical protein